MAQIRQKGYTYTRNGKRVHVAGHLRKDTGKPGRTPKSQQFGVEAREGALGGWSKDKSPAERHRILRGQVARHGYARTVRRLNYLANVTADEPTRRAARSDMAYLKREYR